MDLSYGYSNARVKAMETHLLSPQIMRELSQVKSLAEFTEVLEETTYKDSLVLASTRHSGIDLILKGLSQDFLNSIYKVRKSLPKKGGALFDALTFEWEVQDVKQIISRNALGEKTTLDGLVLYSANGESFAKKLAELTEFDKVLELIEIRYRMGPAVKEFNEKKDFRILLDALDRFYYDRIISLALKLPKLDRSRELLLYRIFIQNALLVLRMKKSNLDSKTIRGQLVYFGKEKNTVIEKMIASPSFESALSVLDDAKGYRLKKSFEEGKKLWELELELEKHFFEKARKALRIQVLSFSVIVGFLYLKMVEVGNLKKLALGKHFGIEELLKQHLVN